MASPTRSNPLSRRRMLILSSAGLGACSMPAAPSESDENAAPTNADDGAAACWSALQPLPFAVQEIYPTAHRGRIHLAGGLLGQDGQVIGVSNQHIAYDPASGATETLGALPAARHHPQLVSLNDRLYCLGGFLTRPDAVNWMMTDETLIYDDAGGRWSPLASAPEAHGESVATVIGDRIHIVGGRRNTADDNLSYGDHTDSASHLVFSPASNSWDMAAPALTPRNSAAGAHLADGWHVAGGRALGGGPMDTHEVYDPAEDRWRTAAPLPQGIGAGGNAAGVLDGKLYVFGGETRTGVHPEVCCYDPSTDEWEIVGEMITPRHGLGGVTLDGAIYAVAGAVRPSGNGTSDAVEKLALDCA